MKTGRLSKQEWNFIERNADRMTPEQIALELNRELDPILNHLRKIGKSLNKKEDFETQAEYDLKTRPYWKELRNQFTEEELDGFLYYWKTMIGQFNRDVLPTEELQILTLCKLEILMNRALREQRDHALKIEDYEGQLMAEKRERFDDQDRDLIFDLERQIAAMRSAKEALSKDFKDLQTKQSSVLKDLKATRDQRLDRINSNKQTIDSLITKLNTDPVFKEECSVAMEKMRLAIIEEKKRLGAFHTFDDGEIDRPFLSDETVFFED